MTLTRTTANHMLSAYMEGSENAEATLGPSVTVVLFPRERFQAFPSCLQSVLAYTDLRHKIVIFDCLTPPAILAELERIVAGRAGVTWERRDRYMTLNEIRNTVAMSHVSDYVCFLENACLVEAGWIEAMLAASAELEAGIISPRQEERTPWSSGPHHDRGFGDIIKETKDGREVRRLVEMIDAQDPRFGVQTPIEVRTVESHCMFFSGVALKTLAPFDEELTAATHVDICIAAMERGIKIGFAPKSRVVHLPMVWSRRHDMGLYRFRWDVTRAAQSVEKIASKWSVVNMPDAGDFAWQQHFRTNPISWLLMRLYAVTRRWTRYAFS